MRSPVVRREHCGDGAEQTHLTDKVEVDGKMVDVISAGETQQDPETGELRIKTVEVLGRSSGMRAASTCSAPTRAVATSLCVSSTAAATHY